jgi:predicted metal-binding membrane protein
VAALIVASWGFVLAAYADGHASWFDHEQLVAGLRGSPVVAGWAMMALAMMGPSCVPVARYVSANTLRPRRAVAFFFATYLVTWTLFLAVFAGLDATAHALVGEEPPLFTAVVAGAAFLMAAKWQLTALKRRFLRACRTVDLIPASGGSACRRLGMRQGLSCVGSCGPLMLATMAAPFGRLLWMPLIAVLAWLEKAAAVRRRLAKPSAAVLGAMSLIYAIAVLH